MKPGNLVPFRNATDVAQWRMCIGCGACVYACTEKKIELVDILNEGLRPIRSAGDCGSCTDCVTVCPGVGASHPSRNTDGPLLPSLKEGWGPVLEVWEGNASDADLRFKGSSGGLASALALYCIEREGMHGLLHAGHDTDVGYRNKTVFSRSRADILAATGSRYAPASPCDNLEAIEKAPAPCVFIGKPCDVEGVRNAEAMRPQLSERLGIAIGIFCAGTPSTQGTLDLLTKHGIDPSAVEEVRYRGRGWPGKFSVRMKGSDVWKDLATYADAWGFLEAYRPFRCHLCPDSTSEFADIACGDPWYRPIEENEEGLSLVLVRTEIGRRIVRGAREFGYVSLQPVRPDVVDASQEELRQKRGAIWGRLVTMKAMGVPAPKFDGFSLFRNWRRLSVEDKVRSFAGTVRRVVKRRYHRPNDYLS